VLLRTTAPVPLEQLTESARRLQGSDPIRAILARIDALAPRKSER
jgi:hypothetical protein